ncbi:MAG: hypothetical protein IPP19_03610 [Verrucomicrobia bacterium]|nr:hypothetical protein [Verrucomicrobiota bacterium]
MVTTILWYAYQRYVAGRTFQSVYAIFIALADALTDHAILLQIEEHQGKRYILSNPTLPEENLVAKWNIEENKRDVAEFFAWASDYKKFIQALAKAEGRHVLQEQLTSGLGSEQVMPIFKADVEAVAPGSPSRPNFGYVPSLGILGIAAASSAIPLKAHTFHGTH